MTESTSFWSREPLPSKTYSPSIADAIILVDLLAVLALIMVYSLGKFLYPNSGHLNIFQT